MGASIARRERQALAALLEQLGPDEPTLCVGWTTADIAAHLVIRERRLDAAIGILGGPLAKWNAKVMTKYALKFARNITLLRNGPPFWSPLRWFDTQLNTLEMLIHHEDVRRAQSGWVPRDLSAMDEQLWLLVRRMNRFSFRRADQRVMLATADGRACGSAGGVRVVGEPMELLLYLMGRTKAARVDIQPLGE